MALARGRRERGIDYWPGFVDALSTLVLGIIFLLTVFVVIEFFLSQEVSGKDTAIARLNSQIMQLTDLLALEKGDKTNLEDEVARTRASLSSAESERDRLQTSAGGTNDAARARSDAAAAAGRATELSGALENQKRDTARAMSQVELLNQQILALRRQLAAIEDTLNVTERRDRESQTRLAELGQRLNVALAQRVQELNRYRSDFFGRLRDILGTRPEVRIVGDRFVFQSEVLFDAGAAVLKPEGRTEIDQLANAIMELERQIPGDLAWVMRVDGHTDARPINTPQFPSNWALSSSRAISVVQYLVTKGVSPQHLVAAGFGEFQPIDPGSSDDAYRRNRRIELKLTER